MDKAGGRRLMRDYGMRSRWRLTGITVALALSGAFLTAGPGTGCVSFFAESALVATDFCFIFDCQNGLLGGTVDPCPNQTLFDGEAVFTPPTGPVFWDCPNVPVGP